MASGSPAKTHRGLIHVLLRLFHKQISPDYIYIIDSKLNVCDWKICTEKGDYIAYCINMGEYFLLASLRNQALERSCLLIRSLLRKIPNV
jgi:hypothetical protein